MIAQSFSTYVITWENASEEEQNATVHFGELKDGAFTEFDETKLVALDTSASTVSLNVNFPGYSFSSAEYKASASADPVEIDSILYKDTAGAWQVNAHIDEAAQRVNIADGSDIYVYYAVPTSPNPQSGDDVEGPTTEKTVTNNGDGTFTIRLDTVGAIHEDVQQTGANVLIVLDTTYSMASSMTGASNRFEAARSAILTLIDPLDCGTNDIDLALVEFNSVGSIVYNWTKDYTTFRNYIASTAQHATGPTGTNWESGLYYARQVLDSKDSDATYVIFLTDGEPNRRGTTASTNAGTSTAISYALTQAQAITATANTSLYGVFCGSASGYNNLNNMINNAGGVETINGTDSASIEAAFEGIAQTIVSNLGASGVSVDDGIPSLSSVSASVTGEAGGFQYYITPKGGTEQTWTDAPGATYSQENGVTWDLSSVGVLQDGYTYSLEFTVWPSQAAYDLIADLNNGKVKYEDLDQATKDSITGSKETGYTMKTNTHLQTTYTYNGTTYTDPFDASAKAMDLPTETITVEKLWHNYLDGRTDEDIDGLQMVLSRDGEEYLEFDVSSETSWKKDNIYISCGQIVNGEVKETGHDYFVTEKAAETVDKTAYWEVDSPVYHPMVINGTATMLILDEEATAAVEGTTYKIGDKFYTVASEASTMTAVNERVSWLNLIKTVTGEVADPDQLFTFSVTINEPTAGADVFFSVFGGGVSYRDDVETSATKWVEEGTHRTYYVAKSGEAFTVSVKADWSTRFSEPADRHHLLHHRAGASGRLRVRLRPGCGDLLRGQGHAGRGLPQDHGLRRHDRHRHDQPDQHRLHGHLHQ